MKTVLRIVYPIYKTQLGLTPSGRKYKCMVRRGEKSKDVVLIADENGVLSAPRGWNFVVDKHGRGYAEDVETGELL